MAAPWYSPMLSQRPAELLTLNLRHGERRGRCGGEAAEREKAGVAAGVAVVRSGAVFCGGGLRNCGVLA